MSEKETAQDVIDSYRKKQQRMQKAPWLFLVIAILVIAGATMIVLWLFGPEKPSFSLFATETPTPTVTSTSTPTATSTATATQTPTSTQTPTVTLTPTIAGPFVYEVLQGDTLFSIAEKFSVDMFALIAINNLDPAVPIDIGDKLTIPGPDTQLPTDTPIPLNLRRGTIIEYLVKPGETLAIIAEKFNSIVDEIVKENSLDNPNDIQAGVKLRIPVNLVTPVPTSTTGPTITPLVTSTVTATP